MFGDKKTRSIRIGPQNLVLLVWANALKQNKDIIDFNNICGLFNWFLVKRKWKAYFKGNSLISRKTPELTYNKYIKYSKIKLYDNLAFQFYIDCFVDITEPLKRAFPNPVNYANLQAIADASIAIKETE